VPLAFAVIVTQTGTFVVTQLQLAGASTLTVRAPPDTENCALAGDNTVTQEAAACVTVKVWPAMVSVPVRGLEFGLLATANPTAPLPEPEAPLVTVIQASLLTAVQLHPPGAVTLELPEPPPAAKF
jgi:hypothetical protein